MSHVTKVETKLDNKVAVKAACKELGIDVEENRMADLGYGNKVKGDLVLTLKGGTQLALVWNEKQKSFDVKCDFYSGGIERLLGKDLRKLKMGHAFEKLKTLARKQGFRVTRGTINTKTGEQEVFLYPTK